MILDYLRLAFATVVVLAPGRLAARACGLRSSAANLAFALGAIFLAWAVVFTVHGDIWLALAVVGLVALAALALRCRRRPRKPTRRVYVSRRRRPRGRGAVFAGGVVLGLLLWPVAGAVSGDGLFHLARVRKLVDLGNLHLRSVDELAGGGLHPGYAFPLWHGFLALVSLVSGLDPRVVVDHEASLLAPLALVCVWEAGAALLGSGAGGVAVVLATLGLFCFAPGHGGSYATLALPPTVARQLLVPAFYALFFGYLASGRRVELAPLALLFGALALTHSTYALFSLIPLVAVAVVRFAEWRRFGAALVAAGAPAFAVYLWLRPLIDETMTHNPSAASTREALLHFGGQLVVSSNDDFRLAAGVVGRSGAVAVAALALVPVAGIAARRRWGAFVLAGSVTLLALVLVPPLFVHFSDVVTISQSRRAIGFLPFAFAFAGGLALLSRSLLVLPAALAAGIVLEQLWPGDFGAGTHGGPAVVTWFALAGGALALALGLWRAPRTPYERPGVAVAAALLFVLPVAIHGFEHWSAATPHDPTALPPALVAQIAHLPPQAVVIAAPWVSYEILADEPVYVVASELAHVAHTRANDPEGRIKQVDHWLATGDPEIPRRYGATWAVGRSLHLYRLTP